VPRRFPARPLPPRPRLARVALLCALCALCVSASAAAEPPPAPPPWAAALFSGAPSPLTFAVTHTAKMYDPEHPSADADGIVRDTQTATLTCALSAATLPPEHKRVAWYATRLTCEGADYTLPYTLFIYGGPGLWAADADIDPADLRALLSTPPHLARTPKEGEVFKREDEEGFGAARSVLRVDDTWCASSSAWGGDESWDGFCLSNDGTLTSQTAGWAGGSEVETRFILTPTPKPAPKPAPKP
jgi:hypothetical protein